MSISDLFNKPGKKVQTLANASFSTFVSASEIESENQVRSFAEESSIVRPPVDYNDPKIFARFGSAKKYYSDSFRYIYENYPYDGSSYEKNSWHVTASNLDNWIFDNVYPRTTGYAIFSPSTTAITVKSSDGYGNPSTKEYITFYGGPNKDAANTDLNKIFPSEDGTANLYNVTQNRASNLKFDLSDSGVTVEFWMTKPFVSGSDKEIIFDMWNQATSSVAGAQRADYGRLRIEITGAADSTSPFLVTALSGTSGFQRTPIGSTLTAASVADDTWRHYAFTFKNNGSNVDVELYQNGTLLQTVTTGSALGTVTGSMKAHLGALVTEVSGTHSYPGTPDFTGWGKLSGSVDEFRYWKTKRNAKQIGLNWYTHVNGGTNTDTANTDLGVYYKFNEGITTSSSLDSVVLDYSGRITNGTWTGYTAPSRNIGSAIVDAGYREFKDPIIYKEHPDVDAIKTKYIKSGSVHDANNTARMTNMIPSWIFEDEDNSGNPILTDITQIVSSYFDELSSYITHIPEIKNQSYNSGSNKPLPFAGRLLRNYGFKYDEIFTAATIIEDISQKNEDIRLSKKVSDIKNLLYNNIYNNLTEINKTKGTSTAFRNLLHCLGIDEDVIKVNIYADDITYEVRDNVLNTSQYSRFVDFNNVNRHQSVVFQMASPSHADSVSFISGSGTAVNEASGLSWTFESEIVFPLKPELGKRNFASYDYPHLSASLFGMHTAKMQNASDTSWAGDDYANFQVYAVRDRHYSKDVTFVLTGTSGGPIPHLSSSKFRDVYDNSKWNFAVRVSPTKRPLAKFAFGTSGSTNTYDVEFYGVSTIAGQVNNEFSVSSSVAEGLVTNFLSSPKRAFVGAHRTNFTSSVLQNSDVRIKSFKVWTDRITDEEILAHAKDTENYGRTSPGKNVALFNTTLQGLSYPQNSTLALHWRFDDVTGSNSSGQFEVTDFSSGSTKLQERYAWAGNVSQAKHSGLGYNFPVSNNNAIDVDWVQRQKKLPFENVNSDDDVTILTDIDDKVFTRDSRPINYYYTLEKSMYQAISEEMLAFFATVKDFNNLIGEPVNRYRQEYKAMEKLRELFFERVENTPDLDKFVNYYKWFDDAVGTMLSNLVPASARFDTNVNTVIESHSLERNKYWNKFPTIEAKVSNPESSLKSINELLYNWKFGHAPLSGDKADNCLWINDRAERTSPVLTSGNSNVDANRQDINTVATTIITGSTYVTRRLSTPYRLVADRLNTLNEQSKKYENKKEHFYKGATHFGVNNVLRIPESSLKGLLSCNDDDIPAALKKNKLSFKAQFASGSAMPYEGKGNMLSPFTMFSSSVRSGYSVLLTPFNSGTEINNMHQDVYENMDAPLQGPFTEKWVGGSQHRHIKLNFYDPINKVLGVNNLDGEADRPEAFRITYALNDHLQVAGPDYTSSAAPRARYFRDGLAKRPVNIANIKMTGASPTVIGNYTKDYQYFQTSGRDINNLWFRSGSTGLGGVAQPTAMSQVVSGTLDFQLPNRSILEDGSRNKTVFVERFSSPGGPEVNSRGFLDTESETYSIYNALPFRNLTVREHLNLWSKQHSAFGGYDAIYASPTASYHKTYRNGRYRIEQSNGTLITASVYDNAFIQHPIPQSDANYSWISASLAELGKGGQGLFGYLPNLNSAFSSSAGYVNGPANLTASEVGSAIAPAGSSTARMGLFSVDSTAGNSNSFVPTDFVGINSNIYEPLSIVQNTRGYPASFTVFSYVNAGPPENDPISNDGAAQSGGFLTRWTGSNSTTALGGIYPGTVGTYFNALIHHRQGPYGWPTWKQIRGAENPIAKALRKNNMISVTSLTGEFTINPNGRTQKIILNQFTESAVTVNRPMRHKLIVKDEIEGGTNQLDIYSSYSNLQDTFNNTKLNDLINIPPILDQNTIYDNLLNYYQNPQALGIDDETNPVESFLQLQYGETIYPRKKNIYLSPTRQRETFTVEYWRDLRSERTREGIRNSLGKQTTKDSMWMLDGRADFENSYAYIESGSNGNNSLQTASIGELQNPYSIFHMGKGFVKAGGGMNMETTASALFCKPILEEVVGTSNAGRGRYAAAGDAKWEAGTQAAGVTSGPFYQTYAEYAEGIKAIGKGYSLIPEFRMSEHMDFYINTQYGDFLSDNKSFLTLTGSAVSSSADERFFKTYSTTDFLKHFKVVNDDHEGFARPSKIKLKCKGLAKFLPYEGFYPAQRSMQLVTLFSQSYGSAIKFSGSQASMRTAIEPLFAPGVLFNSIKSAIAVDYPIYTGSYTFLDGESNALRSTNRDDYHFRTPFESLVEPEFYLGGKNIVDMNPQISASLNSTASLPAAGKPTYKLAMHNFLAECPKFFLEDQKFTTFASKDDRVPFVVPNGINPENGKEYVPEYRMRIVMSHALLRNKKIIRDLFPKEPSTARHFYSTASYALNPGTIVIHRRYPSDPLRKEQMSAGYGSDIPLQNARYGSEFGPPTSLNAGVSFSIMTRTGVFGTGVQSEYTPHTPPYYDGYSDVEIIFKPALSDTYGILDILSDLKLDYTRFPTAPRQFRANSFATSGAIANDFAFKNAMQLSSSLNFLQTVEVKNAKFDENGNAIEIADSDVTPIKWVIQPKWETPVLDFTNASVTLPKQGTGSVPLGIWHQYGEVPSDSSTTITDTKGVTTTLQGADRGLFISIQDLDESEKEMPSLTGSLADLVGFPKEERKMGQVAPVKTISEAIVAVPFIRKNDGSMAFYNFPKGQRDLALGEPSGYPILPGKSIIDLVTSMQKYVLPPKLDFITNKSITPFNMYLFEFHHDLDRKDLTDIWQNLPPQSLMQIKDPLETEVTVEHELLINELFGLRSDSKPNKIKPQTQWMVFKVKQKAEKNYFAMTADASDDSRFRFKFDIGDQGADKGAVPDYSFNWPYDFFSMVELVQMDADITWKPGSDFDQEQDVLEAVGMNPAKAIQPGPVKNNAKVEKEPLAPAEAFNKNLMNDKLPGGSPGGGIPGGPPGGGPGGNGGNPI